MNEIPEAHEPAVYPIQFRATPAELRQVLHAPLIVLDGSSLELRIPPFHGYEGAANASALLTDCIEAWGDGRRARRTRVRRGSLPEPAQFLDNRFAGRGKSRAIFKIQIAGFVEDELPRQTLVLQRRQEHVRIAHFGQAPPGFYRRLPEITMEEGRAVLPKNRNGQQA
jgi:hypothetical protein